MQLKYNKKRHKLLKELSRLYLRQNKRDGIAFSDARDVGLTFKDIDSFLNVNEFERELIISELDMNNEIIIFNLDDKGCFINDKNGLASFSNRKYLIKNQEIVINNLKAFTQIIIPVLSLVIAYFALSLKFTSIKERIEEKVFLKNNKQIQSIELKLEKLMQLKNKEEDCRKNQIQKNE